MWVRHDERVAAFTALGMGRAGHPAAVVTTSGTAAANLHPAVLEAHHTGVPLVAVTADRPQSLRGTWANQTSELQSTLFGGAVRAHCDLAVAEPAQLAGAITSALGGGGRRPGPVHLDLGFEEPLLPDGVMRVAAPRFALRATVPHLFFRLRRKKRWVQKKGADLVCGGGMDVRVDRGLELRRMGKA